MKCVNRIRLIFPSPLAHVLLICLSSSMNLGVKIFTRLRKNAFANLKKQLCFSHKQFACERAVCEHEIVFCMRILNEN
ncbi:CLUMA_CG011127, isoform A [Clunio marinus]|uniref:CLUMA_CG011127, isoform A n=1 Tax=Clunio marinus TaxID=568069 RepID=A0A1J1IDB6_9DIPT|nr:CLUMA_CG011127, isoform A [Clunio marinus]